MLLYFVVQIVGSLITLVILFLYDPLPLNNPLFMGKARCFRVISYAFRSSSSFSHLLQLTVSFVTEEHQKLKFIRHVLFYTAVLSWSTSQLTDKGSLFSKYQQNYGHLCPD